MFYNNLMDKIVAAINIIKNLVADVNRAKHFALL